MILEEKILGYHNRDYWY